MGDDTFTRPDSFPCNQFAARELLQPRFGRPQEVRGGNAKPVRTVAWSSDGRRIATGTEYKGLRIWEAKATVEAGSSFPLPSSSKPSPHNGHITALAWSPVNPHVLVSGCKGSSGGGVVAVWDVVASPSAAVATFKITGDVLHVAFHPSGNHFAVVCPRSTRDEVFFFWLIERNGTQVWEQRSDVAMGGPSIDIGVEEINSLRFSNSGKLVCAVSNDGSLNAWVYPTAERPPLPVAASNSAVNTDDTATRDSTEPHSGLSSPKLTMDADAPQTGKSRAPSQNSRDGTPEDAEGDRSGDTTLDIGADDTAGDTALDIGAEETTDRPIDGDEAEKTVAVDVEMTEEPAISNEAAAPSDDVEMTEHEIAISSSTPQVVSASATVPATPVTAFPSRQPTPAPAPEAEPNDEAKAAAARALAELELEKRKHRQLVRIRRQVCHSASLLSLSFDPYGRFLGVGGQDAMLSLFDTRDWICQRTFDVTTAAIRYTAFSPDGELIAIGGDDAFIAIVSIFSGAAVARIPVTGVVNALVWHPIRNVLAYSTSSKVGVVWYLVQQE